MTTTKTQRVFVFIDAENVRNSCEYYGYKDLDYKKIQTWLKESYNAERIYIYVGIPKGDNEKLEAFKTLQRKGFYVYRKEVVSYPRKPLKVLVECPSCHEEFVKLVERKSKTKANCDAELTLDIVRFGVRKKYDQIIVFSCDGDFARVYEYVSNELRRKVKVYAPSDWRTSSKVKHLNKTGVIQLEDLKGLFESYAIKKEPPEGGSFE
jgi:uncharacterized LabA/DUF88 family protein